MNTPLLELGHGNWRQMHNGRKIGNLTHCCTFDEDPVIVQANH